MVTKSYYLKNFKNERYELDFLCGWNISMIYHLELNGLIKHISINFLRESAR